MKQNIENYYQQKRKKKKINKLKITLAIAVIFILILFSRHYILKSNSPYTNKILEDSVNNEKNKPSIIDEANENAIENKKENISNSSNQVDNENNTNNIEQKENWKIANEDYFKDAVFIGDSRTEGFILNNGLTAKITSFTHKGLTVDTIFTDKVININGKKLTIMEALKETSFSKVYIMLGINEIGWVYSDIFINKYAKIVDEIKKINPKCTIYIQSIIPVTEQVSNEHQYIRNSKIEEYNSLLKKMADEKDICYLNIQEAVINEHGLLPNDAATDGIHLNKKYCEKWFEYLKEHTK